MDKGLRLAQQSGSAAPAWKARQNMRLSVNEDGGVRIDLEPDDEQITITSGPAVFWCIGGTQADPGTGPLVRVIVTDRAVKEVVNAHPVRVGHPSLEGQCSP
jgi:hypothetical protein